MDELLSSYTALPNLHPAVVHFPVALLPLAVVFDLVGLAWRRQPFWERLAAALYALGALGAALAVWAGERAADSLLDVPPPVQPAIGRHSDAGHLVLYVFGLLAAVRLYLCWRDRRAERLGLVPVRAALAAVGLYGVWLVFAAADQGGALVYRHGLAVARPESPPAAEAATLETATPETATGLVERADGTLVWAPVGGAGDALAPLDGADGATVAALDGGGVAIEVSGFCLLLFEPELGDVQVEAELDLGGFTGRAGVAHHVRGLEERAHFAVGSDGTAELVDVRGGRASQLAQGRLEGWGPAGSVTVAVSSAGRHLKGLVDGRTVTHGHVPPPPAGRVGLFFDGTGSVRCTRVTITPLGG